MQLTVGSERQPTIHSQVPNQQALQSTSATLHSVIPAVPSTPALNRSRIQTPPIERWQPIPPHPPRVNGRTPASEATVILERYEVVRTWGASPGQTGRSLKRNLIGFVLARNASTFTGPRDIATCFDATDTRTSARQHEPTATHSPLIRAIAVALRLEDGPMPPAYRTRAERRRVG